MSKSGFSLSQPPHDVNRTLAGTCCGLPRQHGYTLLELCIVVLILSILAAVTVPFFYSSNPEKLDAAAEIQAEAMRFARSEAQRLGNEIGFSQEDAAKRMRIFSVDTASAPWTLIFDRYHPVSKKLWDISLDTHPFAAADTVTTNRVFRGTCNTPGSIYFDESGIARCSNPENIPLERYEITLTLGNETRTVSLNGFSGKVTVQ